LPKSIIKFKKDLNIEGERIFKKNSGRNIRIKNVTKMMNNAEVI